MTMTKEGAYILIIILGVAGAIGFFKLVDIVFSKEHIIETGGIGLFGGVVTFIGIGSIFVISPSVGITIVVFGAILTIIGRISVLQKEGKSK